ncbi:MAG: M20/M25/M40 family metallo-hydrolase [Candidatus Aminicenantes bacterium]|nr:MAG: M20/M25/M40 family metallo-hydrolase [Candidatus Aminicenantes bacterium]
MRKKSLYMVFCAGLLGILCAHAFSQNERDIEELYRKIEIDKTRHIAFLQQLIQAQKGGEETVQALVAKRFEELGCAVETLSIKPTSLKFKYQFAAEDAIPDKKRISVVGKYPGSGNGRSLLMFAHPDSEDVRSTERWAHDPFAGEIDKGRIYGWGVADDLSGVAVMTEAISALLASGQTPGGDVILCSTPAKKNAQGVIALLSRGYVADASIYLHPAESGVGMREIKAIASGLLQFRIIIRGQVPKTTEPGKTAFAHLGINPISKADLIIQALQKLDATRGKNVHHKALDDKVGRSTNLLISYISSGSANGLTQVPEECTIGASLTFPPGEELKTVMKEIEDCVAGVADKDAWLKEHPPVFEWIFGSQGVEVPVDHPLYRTVSDAIREVTGEEPFVNPLHSASDIRNPHLFSGIPTVGYGPLGGDLSQNGNHDEWVDVADYIRAIKITAKAILEWGK